MEGATPPGFDWIVEAAASGEATAEQLELLASHPRAWRATLDRLLDDTEEQLDSLRSFDGPERDQVVADFEDERDRLAFALARLDGDDEPTAPAHVELQASWSSAGLVLWAAGPGRSVAHADELVEVCTAAGVPAGGRLANRTIALPSGANAAAETVGLPEALGWLVAVGAGQSGVGDGIGASVAWLGRVALWAVRLVANGAIVPTMHTSWPRAGGRGEQGGGQRTDGNRPALSVRWMPALVDRHELDRVAGTMPGAVGVVDRSGGREIAMAVLGAVVHAVATDAARWVALPAAPPSARSRAAVAEAFVARLDGSSFEAPSRIAGDLARTIDGWARPVVGPVDARLVVQLDPPDRGGAWRLSVLGPSADGRLVPLEVALVDGRSKGHLADDLVRLERLLPVLKRPGELRRGTVVLSQGEAWELMTTSGPSLVAAGFDVRVPEASQQRPTATLRLSTESTGPSAVGAQQLANVRWSAVFDDVELSAAEIAKLAAEARPLVRSRGKWVELDRLDLAAAAAALAERAAKVQLTGAEILRFAIGLEPSPLAGRVSIGGTSWATELLAKAEAVSAAHDAAPEGFVGTLRSYQSEALAWLGFLDGVDLGGCLALDMGLGKTPTVLAHLSRTAGTGTSLVIAPPAVVGNWAAEAARFTPGLRVVVHHGAARASAEELEAEVAGADIVITTYGTAVRDIEALEQQPWARVILDEAQAIKNPASDTARQLRRLGARSRLALTGTPIENGLGDLWAILDFTNPGLVGSRSTFIDQLAGDQGDARQRTEGALRALNGILVFRRTKSEPEVAAELPERIDEVDHCTMTAEQIGLYQAVLDRLLSTPMDERRKGEILATITALKQVCNHPSAYQVDENPLAGRSGKLTRLEEIIDAVFAAGERVLVFTHFAEWGKRLADHLTARTGMEISCYHGGLARGARDALIREFQSGEGPGALVLSLKAGGTGLNLTAASHVVLYDRWWNPAVEDQARDRAWRIGQTRTVICHRLVCPGTVDERVEEVVAGKRHVADMVLPKSSTLADLDPDQLRTAFGLQLDQVLTADADDPAATNQEAA